MEQIIIYGQETKYNRYPIKPEDLFTILSTSGSTGNPKGVMVSESLYRRTFNQCKNMENSEYIHFSYRPLAWAGDRDAVIATFLCGGRTAFSSGDAASLMEELALVRPTDFFCPPIIVNRIYNDFKVAVVLSEISTSENNQQNEMNILKQFSKLIPIRCKEIVIGSAFVSVSLLTFLRACFPHTTVIESYGITECGGITHDSVVLPGIKYRLESVPELGYNTDDVPYSRGELLVKTPFLFSAYLNNPEETSNSFTDDGFFRTGDIVQLQNHSQHHTPLIRVIDRKKNFFKLAQGQFVSPEYLEGIYIKSYFIDQIYIHGDIQSDIVNAVIVPNRPILERQINRNDSQSTFIDWNKPSEICFRLIKDDLRCLAKQEQLRPYEIPHQFIIEPNKFTSENGFLTATLKLCRYKLHQHYGHRFNNNERSLELILQQIINSFNETSSYDDENKIQLLSSIVTDSLSGVRLSKLIEKDLGLSVPLNILFDPSMTIDNLKMIVRQPWIMRSFSTSVHSRMLANSQLEPSIKLFYTQSNSLTNELEKLLTNVFISGATGFVGCFLLSELIERLDENVKMICLVRSSSNEQAMERIEQTMKFYCLWKDSCRSRIVPLSGDLSERNFGLDPDRFYNLSKNISIIYHCASEVNFVLPYDRLYKSNVVGTQEIIRLSQSIIDGRRIPIEYMSSLSVFPSRNKTVDEISIDEINSERLCDGYSQTKWVSEKLLEEVRKLGHPVKIYRLGRIGPDSKSGRCNPHDLYTLLLSAIIESESYPERMVSKQDRISLIPVDVTSKLIVDLREDETGVYHLMNNRNEIDLSKLIEIRLKMGKQAEPVDDKEWYQRVVKLCEKDNKYECIKEFLLCGNLNERWEQNWNSKSTKIVTALDSLSFDEKYYRLWLSVIISAIKDINEIKILRKSSHRYTKLKYINDVAT